MKHIKVISNGKLREGMKKVDAASARHLVNQLVKLHVQ